MNSHPCPMKASAAMHLPKDDERERLPSLGALDFDLDGFLRSINDPPVSLKKDSLECPECCRRGEKFHIRPYQLNFHEAMYLCPNPACSYPMREDRLLANFTFRREASSAVEDDKKELYHQSSDSFGDIFNGFSDSFFDSPMEFTSGFEGSGKESSGNSVPVPVVNEPKTNLFELSDFNTTNSLVPSDSEHPLSQTVAKQQHSSDSVEVDMDTDNQSTASCVCTLSHHDANEEYPMTADYDVPVPKDLCNVAPCETLSCDEPTNSVNEGSDDESFNKPITVLPKVFFSTSMIQWKNEKNSCWLDSILQVAVASDNIRAGLRLSGCTDSKVWSNLMNTYDQSQIALNDGLANSHDTAVFTDSLSVNLSSARENFLRELRKSAKQLEYGEFQSLLEMLPLSLKVDSKLENMFKVKLLWHFQCSNCPYKSARRSDGLIISMPNTLGHFHPLNAQFKRCCHACKSENASTTVWMEQLPPCIVFHFQNGLSHSNLRVLDFAFCGQLYCVFAVVQYITGNARHFVTWIRDIKKDRWLRCDDLREPICQWTQHQPKIPPNEIHMVFWERKNSNGANDIENSLEAIRNEEVINLAESIPIEHFLAHEEETIVIPEDAGSSTATYGNHQRQVFDTSQTEVCARNACGVTADIETSTLMHTSGQNVAMYTSTVHNPGQIGQHNASSQAGPALVSHPTAGFTHTTLQPVPQLENGTMMMIPTDADRQHIQIIAPRNACNIYIVSQSGQMGQPFYLVPATSQKYSPPSFPTLPSFVNNPHSYNMVAQGVDGPLQNQTEKPKGPSKRMRRQYKLSGYSKRVGPANRYTPMQASKSCSSTKSADNICDAASVKSCNSKGDSETRSELSELSDMLPDFEISGNARNRTQATLSNRQLFH